MLVSYSATFWIASGRLDVMNGETLLSWSSTKSNLEDEMNNIFRAQSTNKNENLLFFITTRQPQQNEVATGHQHYLSAIWPPET